MTWATRIAQQSLGLGYCLTVSGLPYIWSTFTLPSSWTATLDGETYTWLEELRLPDTLDAIEQTLEPWIGVGQTGGMTIPVLLSSTMLGLLEPDIQQAEVLAADLSSIATTATFGATTRLAASGVVYIGPETCTYTGRTATTLTGLGRGAYGSDAREHVASFDQALEIGASGPYCSNSPMAMRGRLATLYAIPGRWGSSGFRPYGLGMDSTENAILFRGEVIATARDVTSRLVSLGCSDLTRLLERSIGTRVHTAYAGAGPDLIHVAPDNWKISFQVELPPTYASVPVVSFTGARLQRDDGAGSPEDVPEGLYYPQQVAEYIAYTLGQELSSFTWDVGLSPNADGKYVLGITDVGAGTVGGYFTLLLDANDLLWQELGFTESTKSTQINIAGGSSTTAQRPRPVFRFPATDTPRRLYYRQIGTLDPQDPTDHAWEYADGTSVPSYHLVGEEIVEWESYVDTTRPRISVTRRGVLGTKPREIYIEEGEDELEIRQVIGAEGIQWPRFLRFLMSSDYGWRGGRADIPWSAINSTSFTALALDGVDRRRDIALTESTQLKDLLAPLLVLDQCWMGARDGELYVDRLEIPLEHRAAATTAVLDESVVVSDAGIEFDSSEDRVINLATIENLAYDPGTEEGYEFPWRDGTSVGTYGECEALELDMRFTPGTYTEQRTKALSLCQTLSARYGTPWRLITLPLASAELAWGLQLGDYVAINHPSISSSALYGVVLGLRPIYRDTGSSAVRGTVQCAVWRAGGQRAGGYAPCLAAEWSSYAGGETVLVIKDDDIYSTTSDSSFFAAGDTVRVYTRGSETTAVERVVSSVSTSEIVVVGTAPSGSVVVEAADYNTCGASLQRFVFTSAGDHTLGASDRAYYYV